MKRIEFLGSNYFITEDGQIFNKYSNGKMRKFKLQKTVKGYHCARLMNKDGTQSNYSVARLVYSVYMGTISEGMQIDHIDGNKVNNHISNLRMVSNASNQRHKFYLYRQKNIPGICEYCSTKYTKSNFRQKYCSKRCNQRRCSVDYKKRTGHWHGAVARSERRRLAREEKLHNLSTLNVGS